MALATMIAYWRRISLWADPIRTRVFPSGSIHPGLFGFAVVLAYLLLTAHIGFSFNDEGYLWYGAQRTLSGDIPLRDFAIYDPGRYYWSAAVMWLLHSRGLVALRVATALAGAIGVWIANTLVCQNRRKGDFWFCVFATLAFLAWLQPIHKSFDMAASILLVALLAWLIEQPSNRRCFIGGLGVGLVAIIGRNHGLYGAIADVAALAIMALVERRINFFLATGYWGAGMILGYAPMILAALFIPDFWTWLWASIRVYFEVGGTDIPVSFPWPWHLPAGNWTLADALRRSTTGTLLLLLPLFGLTGVGYSIWRARGMRGRVSPLLLASFLLAIPYTNHAYARAGLTHLSQAIHPMLIGIFALIAVGIERRRMALALAALCCGASVFLLWQQQPFYYPWHEENWVYRDIDGDRLIMNPYIARRVDVLTDIVRRYAPTGTFFIEPYLPGAYAVFDRRAPLRETYVLFPEDTEVQRMELERLRASRVGFAIVQRGAMDNNPIMAFDHTSPLVYEYIRTDFTRMTTSPIPETFGWDFYLPKKK